MPADVNISQQAFDKIYAAFISEDQYFNAESLMVVKNGKLVFETYCRSLKDRDRFRHIQSVTKGITSLIFGIAKSEDYIDSLDETLYSIIPDKFPSDAKKKSITLRHLSTMTSSLFFDNDDFSVEIYVDNPSDPIKYILKKHYMPIMANNSNIGIVILIMIIYTIQRLTGKTEQQWAKERLFDPLDIKDYYWDSDHKSTTMGAHGLHLNTRDMTKIGQMVLNHGRWNGRQFVDTTWIAIFAQKQIETSYQTELYVWVYGFYWYSNVSFNNGHSEIMNHLSFHF